VDERAAARANSDMAKKHNAHAAMSWRVGALMAASCGLGGCAGFLSSDAPTSSVGAARPATQVFAFKKASRATALPKVGTAEERKTRPSRAPVSVACDATASCDAVKSCAEAYHLLNVCGARQLASGEQGVPCPALCGDTIETMTVRLRNQRAATPHSSGPGS